ncbi:MAG TPA: hypothetical protein VD927_06725 [Chryseosolibacter sp.]|nr:hypothetical protein [Chryseosolibacter sp.]
MLGKKLKDKITGFEGIATSMHIYLTGCSQYALQQSIDKDGKVPDLKYFDEGRLEVVGEGISKESVTAMENGCDEREHP